MNIMLIGCFPDDIGALMLSTGLESGTSTSNAVMYDVIRYHAVLSGILFAFFLIRPMVCVCYRMAHSIYACHNADRLV